MSDSGMNMALVGNRNRVTILNYINKKGSASRKEIADATGLTAAAVTQISQGLIKEGILNELGTMDGEGAGRKRVLLEINYNCRYVVSVNIEQTHTIIALCNMKGNELAMDEIPTDVCVAPEKFLDMISEKIEEMLASLKPAILKKVAAISVSVPGIVDRENGIATHAYGIWNSPVNVCELMTKRLNMPCIITNNVDAFAEASSLYGVGRNYDNILVIKWGPGVGGTMLIDNKVYDGRHGKATEIGHFIVRKNGARCNCGRLGCLETVVSYNALNKIVSFDEGEFTRAYQGADAKEKATLDEAIDLFAASIVNIITVMAPDRVILCGFLFKEDAIRRKFLDAVASYDASLTERRILYTELSGSEGFIGPVAAYIARTFT